jgi:hypothetical protein
LKLKEETNKLCNPSPFRKFTRKFSKLRLNCFAANLRLLKKMADLQEALNAHDRVRKSTDLPLFFGRKDKDTVPPNLLVDRINRAATVAQWNTDERKITEFYLTLCDRAVLWWDTLDDNPNINKGNWADIQREFLAAYAPRFTGRTTCTNFQDLIQRNNENVHDYYLHHRHRPH